MWPLGWTETAMGCTGTALLGLYYCQPSATATLALLASLCTCKGKKRSEKKYLLLVHIYTIKGHLYSDAIVTMKFFERKFILESTARLYLILIF